MVSIIQVTTGDIYPGLIVAIFLGIVNVFILLLLLANRKMPVGGRFLKVVSRTPTLSLTELPPAFSDWDGFSQAYEDTVRAYRTNYEKLTGVELDESETDEEEDREMKPFTIMEDFGNLFPQKSKTKSDEIVYEEVQDTDQIQMSKVGGDSNVFVARSQGSAKVMGHPDGAMEEGEGDDKDLFGNQELKKFFGFEKNMGFRGIDEVEIENRRKTAKYIPNLAQAFQDGNLGAGQREREPTAQFLQPFREERKGWNVVSDSPEEQAPQWKPFVVGEFHRKSMNLEAEDDEDEWGNEGVQDFNPVHNSTKQAGNDPRKPPKLN
jgi:hypothetical protein